MQTTVSDCALVLAVSIFNLGMLHSENYAMLSTCLRLRGSVLLGGKETVPDPALPFGLLWLTPPTMAGHKQAQLVGAMRVRRPRSIGGRQVGDPERMRPCQSGGRDRLRSPATPVSSAK